MRLANLNDIDNLLLMSEQFWNTTEYAKHGFNTEKVKPILLKGIMEMRIVIDEDCFCGFAIGPLLGNPDITVATELAFWVNPEERGSFKKIRLMINMIEILAKDKGAHYMSFASLSTSPKGTDSLYKRFGYSLAETAYIKRL